MNQGQVLSQENETIMSWMKENEKEHKKEYTKARRKYAQHPKEKPKQSIPTATAWTTAENHKTQPRQTEGNSISTLGSINSDYASWNISSKA